MPRREYTREIIDAPCTDMSVEPPITVEVSHHLWKSGQINYLNCFAHPKTVYDDGVESWFVLPSVDIEASDESIEDLPIDEVRRQLGNLCLTCPLNPAFGKSESLNSNISMEG